MSFPVYAAPATNVFSAAYFDEYKNQEVRRHTPPNRWWEIGAGFVKRLGQLFIILLVLAAAVGLLISLRIGPGEGRTDLFGWSFASVVGGGVIAMILFLILCAVFEKGPGTWVYYDLVEFQEHFERQIPVPMRQRIAAIRMADDLSAEFQLAVLLAAYTDEPTQIVLLRVTGRPYEKGKSPSEEPRVDVPLLAIDWQGKLLQAA